MKQLKRLALAAVAALALMAFAGAASAATPHLLYAALTPVSGLTLGLASSLFACVAAVLRIGKNRQLSLLTVHSQSQITGTAASLLPADALQLFNPLNDRKALIHPAMA